MVTTIDQMTELAQEFGLAVSAGSDYHGQISSHTADRCRVQGNAKGNRDWKYLKALEEIALKYAP